jgi:predicted DNA binding CopG/RHH family protein
VRPTQRFSDEYLRQARRIPPHETLRFLEDFRLLHGASARSRLISIKVPEPLLRAFRLRCSLQGVRYQSKIKMLMGEWLGRVER